MFLVVTAGMAIVGLVLFGRGIGRLQRHRSFRRRAVRVEARVTELRTVPPRHGERIWTKSPVVAFYTREGRQVQTVSAEGAQPCPYRPGETATVWYEPRDPTVIAVKGMGSFLGDWVAIGFGVLIGAIGVVVGFVQVT